jgi:hypothetical protein
VGFNPASSNEESSLASYKKVCGGGTLTRTSPCTDRGGRSGE